MSRIDPHDHRRLELLARYDGYAPRYTSYPTAQQFNRTVEAETYSGWLRDLDPLKPVSLYVHIPLCARLCWYCGCNTRAINRQSNVTSYVAKLIDELALVEPLLPGKPRAMAVHLGGGTPNMLGIDDLTTLFSAIRHVFRVSPGADIAAELDPSVLTEWWVKAAVFHGLTRASIGVQDLSPEVQAAINRPESFEVVENATRWLREAGVTSVNFDLMYGLPHQSEARLVATIEQCLRLRPDRIALFGYAHLPSFKPHQKLIDETALPSSAERLQHSEAAAERMQQAGYVRIGMDHFALPSDSLAVAAGTGCLHRNFQGYTTDQAETLIGFGASSISRFPQGYAQNTANELAWRTKVGEGKLAIARGLVLTPEDRLRAAVIERLMCDLSADVAAVSRAHGFAGDHLADAVAHLAPLIGDGVAVLEGTTVRITDLGRPFIRLVAAAFDAGNGAAVTYSRAV
jgi:oxygen-independent coproporphyrinogen III oxidase